jgi:hypothetical protein
MNLELKANKTDTVAQWSHRLYCTVTVPDFINWDNERVVHLEL